MYYRPFYLLLQSNEEDFMFIGLIPSYTTYSFTVVLAGNVTSPPTITRYNGALSHLFIFTIWIDTGQPPSPTVGDGTLLEASKPCLLAHWNRHANKTTSSSIIHLIVTQFNTADSTTTAITDNNGTTIHIITLTAAVGYIPTACQFIAIYFATAKVTTVAADASTIHVSFSIAAAAKTANDHLFIVIPYTTAKTTFTTTAVN